MRDSAVSKRELKLNGNGNKKGRRATGLILKQNNNFAHALGLFVNFFTVVA